MGGFEPLVLNPKGLPRIGLIHVWPQDASGVATVSIGLDRDTRANLEKWAKHLGVDVVEGKPRELIPGSGNWTQRLEAAHQADGIETVVFISLAVEAPAEQPVESARTPGAHQ